MPIKDSFNFRPITDTLTTSGVVGAERLRGLSAEGYQVLIDLLPESSPQAVADEREIVQSQGIDYVHIPVDFRHPRPSDFRAFAHALDAAPGKKIHIHCAANYRVSVFYAEYARALALWSDAEAEAFVGSLWEPRDYPGWPEFIAALGVTEC
jgi:protein tyrosine phosphatase (PTP) superfamily phosphohydrolase (DUF442 family)